MIIDWSDPECLITPNFKVKEALTLHRWNRLATKEDGFVEADIIETCQMMEKIREYLGCSINVHCMFRSQKYNLEIGAPKMDVHFLSMACDFDCNPIMTCDEVKEKLLPKLEEFNIRIEKGTTNWVHCDWRMPGPSGRYFNP
jgi:hypothetical protein